ncbi:MAG: spermidine synthase [Sheuella sp.]|nr:spermidine synthase [Sheuella sp.]
MRIHDPYALEFEYIQQMMLWMLFSRSPSHIVQLGLGAASLTKFCYKHYPRSKITAVELNPAVIEICRSEFYLPQDDKRLSVIVMDAMDYVTNKANHSRVDILQVDLYDAQAEKPALDSPEFYQACSECLSPEGMMTVNLFCDAPDHSKNIESMEQSFEAVAWLTEVHDSNIVAIAFKKSPSINFEKLYERAALLEQQLKLPASTWVDGLVQWMHGP